MKAYVHKADGKRGGFVMLSPTASNRSEESKLAAADWAMIATLLVILATIGAALQLVLTH